MRCEKKKRQMRKTIKSGINHNSPAVHILSALLLLPFCCSTCVHLLPLLHCSSCCFCAYYIIFSTIWNSLVLFTPAKAFSWFVERKIYATLCTSVYACSRRYLKWAGRRWQAANTMQWCDKWVGCLCLSKKLHMQHATCVMPLGLTAFST